MSMITASPSAEASAAYRAFLEAKVLRESERGRTIKPGAINPICKPHQRAIVEWAVRGGRRAIFAKFGLGKTIMMLETMRLTLASVDDARGLIIAPLGVRQEFLRDAAMLGTPLTFVRTTAEMTAPGLYLTNYESVREGKIDVEGLTAVGLDEAAVLRGFGGTKTFRTFMARLAGDDRETGIRTDGIPFRFVATATPAPNDYIEIAAYAAFLGVMDVGECKAQPLDAKVLTPQGWCRMGDLRVGDSIIAGDGSPTTVLGVYPQGKRDVYRVTFSDGSSTECDADHLWYTQTVYERNAASRFLLRDRHIRSDDVYGGVRSTAQIRETLYASEQANHTIPMVGAVQFEARAVPIDAWVLGALLGDACLRNTCVTFSTADQWMIQHMETRLPSGMAITKIEHERLDGAKNYDWTITARPGTRGGNGAGSNPLLAALRQMGLLGKRSWEKHVPDIYKFNSIEVRLAVLRGLMDTDGTAGAQGKNASFSSSSERLAGDVQELVQSLGGTATIRVIQTSGRDCYRVAMRLPAGMNPFALPRKAERYSQPRSRRYGPRRAIVRIDPVGKKAMQCIAVSHASRLYVTDDYIVTHNTRFFRRNSEKADDLTLHKHKESEFWYWVNTWAVFLQSPADLGFPADGYELPPLTVNWHSVTSDHSTAGHERDGQGKLLRDSAIGVQDAAAVKRSTLDARVAKVRELIDARPDDHVIVWHDLEDERRAIEQSIPNIASVFGSQDLDDRETIIREFADGEIGRIACKPVMLGSGVNFQRHCHWAIFAGIGFKFNDFIQAIHRVWRYLQPGEVVIDIIFADAEVEVRRSLEAKWKAHDTMMARMSEIIREYGLNSVDARQKLVRTIGTTREVATGDQWTAIKNDCVDEVMSMATDSVGHIVTSIPFGTQYEYSPSYNDFGHTDDDVHFWAQMDFLAPQLLRVLQPGRVLAVHVKDRIRPGGLDGWSFQTVSPFHADAILHYRRHGFAYMGMITVTTDVVRENAQTYRLGWSEQCKDGSKMSVGLPEYVLLFRKPPTDGSNGYADVRVTKDKAEYSRARWQFDAHGMWRSSGNRLLTPDDLVGVGAAEAFQRFREYSANTVYDHDHTVAIAEARDRAGQLPPSFMLLQPTSHLEDVWTDVTRMRTLNGAQYAAGKEMHLCPLQFDIVDRLITRFSNPGDLVLDPFGGLMTVPLRAVALGRRGMGIELSDPYWRDGVWHLRAADEKRSAPSLFDLLASPAGEEDPANAPIAEVA